MLQVSVGSKQHVGGVQAVVVRVGVLVAGRNGLHQATQNSRVTQGCFSRSRWFEKLVSLAEAQRDVFKRFRRVHHLFKARIGATCKFELHQSVVMCKSYTFKT